jgi:RHS repeat-associated protein
LRRPARIDTVNRVGVVQSSFEHEFDNNHSRTFERRVFGPTPTIIGDRYSYDSANRLVELKRDIPNIEETTEGSPVYTSDWTLDGSQNWRHANIDGKVVSSVATVNAYIKWIVGGVTETPSYDLDGNMTSPHSGAASKVELAYDFLNRLREIKQGSNRVNHDYDASGRRVRTTKTNTVPGCPPHVEYVYDGWDVIEEFDGSNGLMRRFVLGEEMDEPIRMETFSFWDNQGTYYYQRSTLGSVVALTNSNGATVERYTYDAYGIPTFQDAAGAAKSVTESDYDNPYLFNARRYEPWLRPLYDFRHRAYDAGFGRFIQRDPIGMWGDSRNAGNAVAFVSSDPANSTDAYGLQGRTRYAGVNPPRSAPSTITVRIDRGTTITVGYQFYRKMVEDGYWRPMPNFVPVGYSGGGTPQQVTTPNAATGQPTVSTGSGMFTARGTFTPPATGATTAPGNGAKPAPPSAAKPPLTVPTGSGGMRPAPGAGKIQMPPSEPCAPESGTRPAPAPQAQPTVRTGDGATPTGRPQSRINRKEADAARREYWKKEAKDKGDQYDKTNLARMQEGKAPMGPDGYPMELHHRQGNPGECEPLSRTDHRLGENYRRNHPYLFP